LKDYLEIRWHGRGGLGVKTAAILFGEALIRKKMYALVFPEYGPERRGAPVTAYTRVSKNPIRAHYGIINPDIVVILEEILVRGSPSLEGLKKEGSILANTAKSPHELVESYSLNLTKVYAVDATRIAIEETKNEVPNTPMLGALVRVTKLISLEDFIESIRERLEEKVGSDNFRLIANAIRRGYREVKGIEGT